MKTVKPLDTTNALVLCVSRKELLSSIHTGDQLSGGTDYGVYVLSLNGVRNSQFDFLPRKIVDQKVNRAVGGLYDQASDIGIAYPQVLPYLVVTNASGQILTYARKVSGEERLLNSRSLGFGGHIEPEDAVYNEVGDSSVFDHLNTIRGSMQREAIEELGLSKLEDGNGLVEFDGAYTNILSAIQYTSTVIIDNRNEDDSESTPVGQVHIGLLHTANISDADAEVISETAEAQAMKWCTLEELKQDYELYESWSRIWIDYLVEKQASESTEPQL